jgi:tetratricopeptide (TPR) repeat protein
VGHDWRCNAPHAISKSVKSFHACVPIVAAFVLVADAGEELWQRGQRAEAIQSWTEQLATQPDNTSLRLRLVRAELSTHRYQAALAHAQALGTDGRAERGAALYRLGKYAEALAELPRESEEQLLMRIDSGVLVAGALDGALADAGELERRGLAATARAQAMLGKLRSLRGEREAAEKHFRKALELDPLDRTALFGLGNLLLNAGREDEGEALLQKHRKVVPLLDQLDFAQRSVDLAPSHGPNHAAVGDALRALGREGDALAAYETAERWCRPEELAPVVLRHARLLAEDRKDLAASVQAVLRWFMAETQGEQAKRAVMNSALSLSAPYRAGVSGPNSTRVGSPTGAAKWAGPESLVTMALDRA